MLSKFFSAFQKYRQQRFESYPTDIFDEGEGVSKHRLVIFWAPLALRLSDHYATVRRLSIANHHISSFGSLLASFINSLKMTEPEPERWGSAHAYVEKS